MVSPAPFFKYMKLHKVLRVLAGGVVYATLGMVSASYAQDASAPGGTLGAGQSAPPYSDLYYSPDPKSGMRVPPSGAINILANKYNDKPVSNTFGEEAGTVGDITNTLGCGGIGQSEFTSGLFNMPETFQKFQQDVNSTLSKDLLSLNFVMPQTSALFDQLNNIGNQRFDQFQRGCNVTQLQQDAKQTYMQACVEKLTPERKKLIEEDNKKRAQNAKIPDNQIGPMAYAQAWEICGNQSVSNTMARDVKAEKLTAFYETTRAVERVDQAIRPYLCGVMSDMRGSSGSAGTGGAGAGSGGAATQEPQGCWAAYLIPQVRSCFGHDLEGGCTTGDYGVRQPTIPMPRLFDTFRFIMEDELVARRVVSFTTQLSNLNIDESTLKLAASDAVLKMSAGAIARNTTSTQLQPGNLPAEPRPALRDFQLDYLNCKNIDAMSPVQKYVDALVRRSKKVEEAGIRYTNPEFTYGDEKYMSIVDQMEIPDLGVKDSSGSNIDKNAFIYMLPVALGCTVNQSVPIFDPNILASLQTQCTTQDRAAFYSMASYDVALQATRDVYRFLGLKLKQTYARLLTESMIPVSNTTDTSVSPTLSPELNSRFAAVVKDTMIPYVEEQIKRLDELSATRGAFGQRVSEIYKRKDGCISQEGGWGVGRGGVRQ